jgi:hypothetical protein
MRLLLARRLLRLRVPLSSSRSVMKLPICVLVGRLRSL